MTPAQLEARNAAIRAAWDDPLKRALMRRRTERTQFKQRGPKLAKDDYNAYYRAYMKQWRARRAAKKRVAAQGYVGCIEGQIDARDSQEGRQGVRQGG